MAQSAAAISDEGFTSLVTKYGSREVKLVGQKRGVLGLWLLPVNTQTLLNMQVSSR